MCHPLPDSLPARPYILRPLYPPSPTTFLSYLPSNIPAVHYITCLQEQAGTGQEHWTAAALGLLPLPRCCACTCPPLITFYPLLLLYSCSPPKTEGHVFAGVTSMPRKSTKLSSLPQRRHPHHPRKETCPTSLLQLRADSLLSWNPIVCCAIAAPHQAGLGQDFRKRAGRRRKGRKELGAAAFLFVFSLLLLDSFSLPAFSFYPASCVCLPAPLFLPTFLPLSPSTSYLPPAFPPCCFGQFWTVFGTLGQNCLFTIISFS